MASLELFEVEDRAVVRLGERAWAFNPGSGWSAAPGLVVKAAFKGARLSPEAFAAMFPDADPATIPLQGEVPQADT